MRRASQSCVRLNSGFQDSFLTLPLMISPLIVPWNIACVTLFVSVGWSTLST